MPNTSQMHYNIHIQNYFHYMSKIYSIYYSYIHTSFTIIIVYWRVVYFLEALVIKNKICNSKKK